MDFLNLLLMGYCNQSDRENLDNYFFRELKKAKQEYYTNESFFNGCQNSIELLKDICKHRLNERKQELSQLMILTTQNKNVTEELKKNDIDAFKKEFKSLKMEDYPVNLAILTKGVYLGNLYFSHIEYIERSINIAEISLNKEFLQTRIKEIENPSKPIIESFKSNETDTIKENKDKDWFKVGVLFAKGKIPFDIRGFNDVSYTQFAKNLGNDSFRPYISESVSGKNVKDKNIFSRKKEDLMEIINYCKFNEIEICQGFKDKCTSLGIVL